MSTERNIRWDLIARLCPNATGAELRSVCTEAGMFAIRERRKVVSEKDCLAAVEKVRAGFFSLRFSAAFFFFEPLSYLLAISETEITDLFSGCPSQVIRSGQKFSSTYVCRLVITRPEVASVIRN